MDLYLQDSDTAMGPIPAHLCTSIFVCLGSTAFMHSHFSHGKPGFGGLDTEWEGEPGSMKTERSKVLRSRVCKVSSMLDALESH